MNESEKNILSSGEIEIYVQNLEPSKIENLGTLKWFESHHRCQKLSQQSTIEAKEMREECVKSCIISYGKLHEDETFLKSTSCPKLHFLVVLFKVLSHRLLGLLNLQIPVLVHEVICIQVWREKIFCQIIKLKNQPQNTFLFYVILFHEITVVSLLQNILYHKDSLEDVGDVVVDLIDYCASEIVRLLSEDYVKLQEKSSSNMTSMEEIRFQSKTIGFNIGLSAICIIRYLIEYVDELSLSAVSRLFKTHDMPVLMANIIQIAPWKRVNCKTNIVQIYEDRTWRNIDKIPGISKYEAQCWIALRFLLLDVNVKYQYELTEFRKQHLIKVQKYLTEAVMDQIPPLMELNRYLAQLSVSNVPSQNMQPLIMETIPEIKSGILRQCMNKWKKITNKQMEMIFTPRQNIMMEVAKCLGKTYDLDHLERLAPEGPICSNCGDAAAKRCSKCKNEWYCGRECQVARWSKHKMICDIMNKQSGESNK